MAHGEVTQSPSRPHLLSLSDARTVLPARAGRSTCSEMPLAVSPLRGTSPLFPKASSAVAPGLHGSCHRSRGRAGRVQVWWQSLPPAPRSGSLPRVGTGFVHCRTPNHHRRTFNKYVLNEPMQRDSMQTGSSRAESPPWGPFFDSRSAPLVPRRPGSLRNLRDFKHETPGPTPDPWNQTPRAEWGSALWKPGRF